MTNPSSESGEVVNPPTTTTTPATTPAGPATTPTPDSAGSSTTPPGVRQVESYPENEPGAKEKSDKGLTNPKSRR